MSSLLTVTEDRYPNLYDCMDCISHDGGGQAGWRTYTVPAELPADDVFDRPRSRHDGLLDVYEAAAATMPGPTYMPEGDERQTFCVGDEDEQKVIASRSPALAGLHDFLNDFFQYGDRQGR